MVRFKNKVFIVTALAITTLSCVGMAQAKSRHSVNHTTASVVDINSASPSQLASIKGFGPKRAKDIVDYRKAHGRFMSVDDLAKVKGIGKKMLVKVQQRNPNRLRIAQ